MKERPILFSAPMVRAILAGTKTQTRRIVKPQPPSVEAVRAKAGDGYHLADIGDPGMWRVMGPVWAVRELMAGDPVDARTRADVGPQWRCPYGVPGDRLWVRETFYCDDYRYPDGPRAELLKALDYRTDHDCNTYEAGCPCSDEDGRSSWRPSIFMPRWASRITLELAEVRVERLHDISEVDARAEGVVAGRIPADEHGPERIGFVLGDDDGRCTLHSTPRDAFAAGWQAINGAESWAANPWVWALTFKCVEEPTP